MITGVVNAYLEARIRLSLRAADERRQEVVESILDTGFNGSLTLSCGAINKRGGGRDEPWQATDGRTVTRLTAEL